jgi:hypothetical protein
MTIRHVSLSKPSQQPNQPITIHQQPKPPMNPCTIKHTETPPTYPFPAYAIVKERYPNSCPAFPRSQHKRHRFRYLMPTPSQRGAGSTPHRGPMSTLCHIFRHTAEIPAKTRAFYNNPPPQRSKTNKAATNRPAMLSAHNRLQAMRSM